MNLARIFERHLGRDRIAYVDLGSTVRRATFDDLDDLCGRIAGGLVARGLEPGDGVGILAANSLDYAGLYFGICRAGFVTMPLNSKFPAETLEYIASDAGMKLVIHDAANRGRLRGVPSLEIGSPDWSALLAHAPMRAREMAADDVAIQMYTSGSTGKPKGVLLSHRSQIFTVEQLLGGSTQPSDERAIVSAPMYHKNAMVATKSTLASGACVILLPRFDARAYLQAIAEHRATRMTGVPTMFALMTAERDLIAKLDLTSVTWAMIGSAPLTEALIEQVRAIFPNAIVANGYGTTEAIAIFGPHPARKPRPAISLGHPLAAVEVRLVDASGRDADEGELWVRSAGVMNGYHKLPDVTAARLTDGWYHTGDVMKKDVDGWFYFVGRVDDMFVCGGENVYPDDVERMLERHPDIHQAAVVPVKDDIKGDLPVAFVVLERGTTLTEQHVKSWSLEHGPSYQHPRAVWFVDTLPLASTAKIDKAALKAEAAKRRVR